MLIIQVKIWAKCMRMKLLKLLQKCKKKARDQDVSLLKACKVAEVK